MIVLSEAHLQRALDAYADYFNSARTHLSLDKNTPLRRPVRFTIAIHLRPILGGLHHQYVRKG